MFRVEFSPPVKLTISYGKKKKPTKNKPQIFSIELEFFGGAFSKFAHKRDPPKLQITVITAPSMSNHKI